jgi:hypothetical protein
VISDVFPDPADAEIKVSGCLIRSSSNPNSRLRTTICGRSGGIVIFVLISGTLTEPVTSESSL